MILGPLLVESAFVPRRCVGWTIASQYQTNAWSGCLERARWRASRIPPNSCTGAGICSSSDSSACALPPSPMPHGKDRRRIGSRRVKERYSCKREAAWLLFSLDAALHRARWSYCQGRNGFCPEVPGGGAGCGTPTPMLASALPGAQRFLSGSYLPYQKCPGVVRVAVYG